MGSIDVLSQVFIDLGSISEQDIKRVNTSVLENIKVQEKSVGYLSEDGRRIYCLCLIFEEKIQDKNIYFIENEPGNTDFAEIEETSDKVALLRLLLTMEIRESIESESDSTIEVEIRKNWEVAQVRSMPEKDADLTSIPDHLS